MDSIVYVCHGNEKSIITNVHKQKTNQSIKKVLTKFYQNKPYWHNTITISLVHHPKDYISKDTLHPATLKRKILSLFSGRKKKVTSIYSRLFK